MTITIFSGIIAGLSHSNPDVSNMNVGDQLALIPEPTNEFDARAVQVAYPEDNGFYKLGYIAKDSTIVYHDAIKNGLTPVAKIHSIDPNGKYPKIFMRIYVNVIQSEDPEHDPAQ